jgi:superfamily II DNA or RNA helicase
MSVEIKLKKKVKEQENIEDGNKIEENEVCDLIKLNEIYSKKCGTNNKELLNTELKNRIELQENPNDDSFLYPNLDDPNFNIKIAQKKEFSDTKYDGDIYDVEEYSKILKTAEYELLPQQAFVRNFLSFQTPYNSLLLFHGLGSGKTCSAIGVCEEMRDYLKQMGINKRIIIVASPNVQDNFKLQLFDERKLKEVDGIWTIKGCLGNKLLKEINPTGMKGLKREKVIQQVKNLINSSYSFQGYVQFSNEIVRNSGKSTDTMESKIRNLENEYSDRLIVIDEVHNIRISDDNENKNVAKNLMFLVSVVSNLRLLLLSATPMFNSYKEIVWLLNLMNMNDRRGIVSISDIFDKNGNWKKDKDGKDIGKEMLVRKATGYVSYVRGENPYTFPFRVYPDRFAPDNTFKTIQEYPKYQINGRKIPDSKKIEKLSLFITAIGDYQKMGYEYIMDRLRNRGEKIVVTRKGVQRKMSSFLSLKAFGYTDLQIPIEALNIVYPIDGLENLIKDIEPLVYYNDEEKEEIEDISPKSGESDKEIVEEIDEVISNGPQISASIRKNVNSELESEPVTTEGIDADETLFEKVSEPDLRNLKKIKKPNMKRNTVGNSIIEEIDIEEEEEECVEDSLKSCKRKINKPSVSSSFKASLVPKKNSVTHIIEGVTKSNEKSITGGNTFKSEERFYIDPKDLTGSQGLKRVMDFIDTKTPSVKGQFEYKSGYPHIFAPNEIGKYSSKIKNICNYIYNSKTNQVSSGIILIYSSYIDAGIIPMALALEEMGFTRYGEKAKPLFKQPPSPLVDVRTMKPPTSKKDFKPARYIMITGDPRISPNNDMDVKAITNNDNIFREDKDGNIVDISGEIIKVVLISQAGSEGLDFKAIRQVHILEPWYNINRLEQIIGRAVRNFSHKDLPFSQRNVQIFLYGTILEKPEEEAVDLYVYRISELKAVKIGKVTRLLKQTAVDCIINHDQTELISKNFNQIEENRNIKQELSDHQILNNFEVGDVNNSATCDFMECEFKCIPDIKLEDSIENTDTYNETFMLVNSEKIIQKIKALMKMRYFYKKNYLLNLINIPKKYPTSQIYAALTQIISDNSEYLLDKYGRTGYLINIGEYYLFQPSELNYNNISIYDRSVPIDYKHNMIKFDIKSNITKPIEQQLEDKEEKIDVNKGKNVLDAMFLNYNLALETNKVQRGNDNWYELCGLVLRKMTKEKDIIQGETELERLEILEEFLIEHIVDSLMMDEKIDILNYIYSNDDLPNDIKSNERLKRFYSKMKKYLLSKLIVAKGITGILIFDGPSRIENLNIFKLNKNIWVPAQPEDKKDLGDAILKKYRLMTNLNHYVGFIGFETNKKFMVYKIKDTANERSTGFRCDQSGKDKIITILNDIETDERFASKVTKDGAKELCVRQELTLRSFQRQKLENKTWFLDTETAIINEFEKKEKIKK